MADTLLEMLTATEPSPGDVPETQPEPPRRRRGRPPKAAPQSPDGGDASAALSSSPVRARTRRPRRRLSAETVEDRLTAFLAGGGAALQLRAPFTGFTVIQRARMAAHSLVDLGRQNPRLMAILEQAVQFEAWGGLAAFGVSIVAALAIESGRIRVDNPVAMFLLADVVRKYAEAQEAMAKARDEIDRAFAPNGQGPAFTVVNEPAQGDAMHDGSHPVSG